MDKKQAINLIKECDAAMLIEVLISNDEDELAMQIIQDCWGDTNDEVANYIEENWNF